MELQQILDLPVFRSDLDEGESVTIRECLFDILKMVLEETECFDDKRPWGYSGWVYDLYAPLIKHNLIPGKLDEDGYIENVDEEKAIKFVTEKIIKPIFYAK